MQEVSRSASLVARRREQTEEVYSVDPKFKKYSQQIEKCLSSFENVQEWADCIAFLKNLLRALQAYSQFKAIPHKLVVSKRLAQCLNPNLPTGVHQRALEVYGHIFAVLGSDGIKRDLAVWTAGLFPFFEYAATSIKPALLSLYDVHFLALQEDLRPAMRSFTLCLLPGLEEETGEFFEQVLSLLDKLSGTVSPAYFFQNLWLVMLTSQSARGTALAFLSRRLPHLNADEDIASIVGRDTGLMIRAVSSALEDENLLVQRAALDLLLQALRLDSKTIKRATDDDRAILMRAAYSVVLRRDLALNRRLYSWLLGPIETTSAQEEFSRKHSLALLGDTLRADMRSPSAGYSFVRPFKILVSLLDKWEIGGPLCEILVVDVLKIMRSRLLEAPGDDSNDVSLTANTLYEAIEPILLWKHVLKLVLADYAQSVKSFEGINLAMFVLEQFHHDEEVTRDHLPVALAAVIDLLHVHAGIPETKISPALVQATFLLAQKLASRCQTLATVERPSLITRQQSTSVADVGPLHFACLYYGIEPPKGIAFPVRSSTRLLTTVLEDLLQLAIMDSSASDEESLALSHDISDRALATLVELLTKSDIEHTACPIQWDPASWIAHVLARVKDPATPFTTTTNIINIVVTLSRHPVLEPRLVLDSHASISVLINRLFRYLHPAYAAYHLRVVQMIWALDAIHTEPYVESVIAKIISSASSHDVLPLFEAFGVLWRLTDDDMAPGYRLQTPMWTILHALSSEEPRHRRAAETWMRNSLRSVLRVVDPLFQQLTAVEPLRTSSTNDVGGRQISIFHYTGPLDQRRLLHLMQILLAVLRYGGQSYLRLMRTSISSVSYTRIADKNTTGTRDASYLDVLLDLLLSYLQSEPADNQQTAMGPFNTLLQCACADVLQIVVSRAGLDDVALKSVESVTVSRLHLAVHKARLDIQSKLLHLLHSVLLAIAPPNITAETSRPARTTFLTQVLVDGITIPSNRPVLQHWFDFILTAIPNPRFNMDSSILLLLDHIGKQLQGYVAGTLNAYKNLDKFIDADTAVSDFDFGLALNAFENLLIASLSDTPRTRDTDTDSLAAERPAPETGGIFGFFGSEAVITETETTSSVTSTGSLALRQAMPVLFAFLTSWPSNSQPASAAHALGSMSTIFSRTASRYRRVFEHLWKARSVETFDCLLECWEVERKKLPNTGLDAVFALVDHLAASAQGVVQMLCDRLSQRMILVLDKSRKQSNTPDSLEWTYYVFLEQYLRRLEGPVISQIWTRFFQLAKDVASNARELRQHAYSMLRCITVISDKVIQSNVLDDRRQRRDFQDTYVRLLEATVMLCSRDQASWLRRSTKDIISTPSGRASPVMRVPSNPRLEEKLPLARAPTEANNADETATISQIIPFMVSDVIPNLRHFLVDADRTTTACSSIIQNVVVPGVKGRQKPLDVEQSTVRLLQEITTIPASLKTWRSLVYDSLNDARVFNSTVSAGRDWQPIVASLVDGDKTVFPEMLSKVAVAPSANIFTNREYEMLLQSLSLRRLSYILLTGEKNHFLSQLPSVVEKLADIFKNVPSVVVQSEVYLCLRVLLCRLSPHNLTVFWPVLLTELLRTFEELTRTLPGDGSESLPLILAASKFVDLLLVLQTQEFQIHQWMFITDTVDAVYRPDDWVPDAMLDQLAELAADLPASESRDGSSAPTSLPLMMPPTPSPVAAERTQLRRPMLNKLRQIDSVRDLVPFFSHVSIATYESIYASGGNVDWEALETGILQDMFDGQ